MKPTLTQLAEAFLCYADHVAEGPKEIVEALDHYEFDDPQLVEKVRRLLGQTPGPRGSA